MVNADTYKELRIPKGGAKAFADALAAQNDKNAPAKRKTGAKKAPVSKKNK